MTSLRAVRFVEDSRSTAEARCWRCRGLMALRPDGDRFVCRDRSICDATRRLTGG